MAYKFFNIYIYICKYIYIHNYIYNYIYYTITLSHISTLYCKRQIHSSISCMVADTGNLAHTECIEQFKLR